MERRKRKFSARRGINNMNFKQWWKKHLKTHYAGDEGNAQEAWDACKKEVLKILEKDSRENIIAKNENYAVGNIEEIEKL